MVGKGREGRVQDTLRRVLTVVIRAKESTPVSLELHKTVTML